MFTSVNTSQPINQPVSQLTSQFITLKIYLIIRNQTAVNMITEKSFNLKNLVFFVFTCIFLYFSSYVFLKLSNNFFDGGKKIRKYVTQN